MYYKKNYLEKCKIVLPEGEDERVLTAATQLQESDYVSPIVLGNEEKLNL